MRIELCRVDFRQEYSEYVQLITVEDYELGYRSGAMNASEYDGGAEYGCITVHKMYVSDSEWRQLQEGSKVRVRLTKQRAAKMSDKMVYKFDEIVEFVELSEGTQAGLDSF